MTHPRPYNGTKNPAIIGLKLHILTLFLDFKILNICAAYFCLIKYLVLLYNIKVEHDKHVYE